ncbi:MAG: flagellar protein FliT [Eubacteriales bacterium]|nr:flagellar protein FliT [Eubacteriales bacterium]
METTNYLQMMIDSLRMKITILKEISAFNEEQHKLVLEPDMDEDAFQKNLDGKGELIDKLNVMDEGFNSLFNRVREAVGNNKSMYSGEINELKKLIRQVTELGVSIEAQEARNKAAVQNKFSSMRKQLQQAKRSTKMANTYYQNMNKISQDPQFLDQKK